MYDSSCITVCDRVHNDIENGQAIQIQTQTTTQAQESRVQASPRRL